MNDSERWISFNPTTRKVHWMVGYNGTFEQLVANTWAHLQRLQQGTKDLPEILKYSEGEYFQRLEGANSDLLNQL